MSQDDNDGSIVTSTGKSGPLQRTLPAYRKTLIPKRLKLTITVNRLNKIYDELQRLDVSAYVNSCAVLLRVFVELSVDEYTQNHSISTMKVIPARTNSKGEQIPGFEKEFSLREKLTIVADYMEKEKICSKDELRGVRTIITNREHVLSVRV